MKQPYLSEVPSKPMNILGEHHQNLLDRSLCLLKDPAVGHGQGGRARVRSALPPSPSNLQQGDSDYTSKKE